MTTRAVLVGADKDGMSGREAQVTGGESGPESASADPYRLLVAGQRAVPSSEVAMADPGDRPQGARGGDRLVADAQISTTTSPRDVRMRAPLTKQTATGFAATAADCACVKVEIGGRVAVVVDILTYLTFVKVLSVGVL